MVNMRLSCRWVCTDSGSALTGRWLQDKENVFSLCSRISKAELWRSRCRLNAWWAEKNGCEAAGRRIQRMLTFTFFLIWQPRTSYSLELRSGHCSEKQNSILILMLSIAPAFFASLECESGLLSALSRTILSRCHFWLWVLNEWQLSRSQQRFIPASSSWLDSACLAVISHSLSLKAAGFIHQLSRMIWRVNAPFLPHPQQKAHRLKEFNLRKVSLSASFRSRASSGSFFR